MTPAERKAKLASFLKLLQTSGYKYELAKTGVHGKTQMPPPPGTGMSCGSAARIFMQLAKDAGIDKLQSVYFTTPPNSGGYFVLDRGSDKALGCTPQIVGKAFKGWEFENHYRVKDTTTGVVYDPTFGTSSASGGNLPGYKATSENTIAATMEMTSVYADRYQVTRKGVQITTVELNKKPAASTQTISDTSFTPKAMDNLR